MRRAQTALPVLVALLCLSLSTPPSSQAALDAIRIGIAIDLTGPNAPIGREQGVAVRIAELFFHDRLARMQGLPMELVVVDTGGGAEGAKNAVRTLLCRQVVAIVGTSISSQAFEAAPLADQAGVPMIAPSCTAKGIPQIGPYVSRVSVGTEKRALDVLHVVAEQHPHLKKVVLAYAVNDVFAHSEVGAFRELIGTHFPTWTIGLEQTFNTTDRDFTATATAIRQAHPDLVIVSGLTRDGGTLVKALRLAHYTGLIIGGNGLNAQALLGVCGRQCQGLFISQAYNPAAATLSNQQFVAVYATEHPGQPPTQFMAQMFTALQVIVESLEKLNAKRPVKTMALPDLRRALNAQLIAGERFETPLGAIWLDHEGEIQQPARYVAQIRHRRFHLLFK